jgi:hypothetical protein
MTYIGVDYDMSFATSHPLLTMHFIMNDLWFVCISFGKTIALSQGHFFQGCVVLICY